MNKWFLGVLFLVISSSLIAIYIRITSRKVLNNVIDVKLSADDFEIID